MNIMKKIISNTNVLFLIILSCFSIDSYSESLKDNKGIYYFNHVPYINPRIINELSAWISDGGDQVVAINLLQSQNSNRFYLKEKVGEVADYDDGNMQQFQYYYIGKLSSGAYVLKTVASSTDGTGVFENLLVLGIVCDTNLNGEKRVLLKKYGEIALGDRWSGQLSIDGDKIVVKTDEETLKRGLFDKPKEINVVHIEDRGLINRCYQGGAY